MRQRREMATLKMQVRAREGRVRQLENVVRALCSAYKVPLPPAAGAGSVPQGECHNDMAAAAGPAAGRVGGQTGTEKNGNSAGMATEQEREDELVKNLFAGPDEGVVEEEDMVVDNEALGMDSGVERPRAEMWVHQ